MKTRNKLVLIVFCITCSQFLLALQARDLPFSDQGGDILHGASWISGRSEIPTSDSLFYLDHPAPLLRTEFIAGQEIAKAEMWITAAGYYETWMNGQRLGTQQLDPAWTNFSKRIYVTYLDVTSSLRKGKNAWGIMLGNGFYNPLPLKMWGGRNIRKDIPVGNPCTIARLLITLKDGTQQEFCTSDKWMTKPGPVTRNSVYLGEWYDARKESQNWTLPGADPKGWKPVNLSAGPGGKPELAYFPPIRINGWLSPVSIKKDSQSRQVIDFGQNMTGLIRVRIQANEGDTIRFRYGELVYPDGTLNPMTTVCGQIKRAGVGGPGAPAVAEQMDVYVAKGDPEEFFQTRFTFHGFRYVEVTGLAQLIPESEIRAGYLSTDVKPSGKIISSSEYLNKLNLACQWTFLNNLQSVQSDCPAREKFGYGGDINATVDAYIYNFDMKGIYRKMIFDWIDAMKPDKFVDTAPFVGIEYCGLSWESAFLFMQNALWIHYGDSELIRELYKTDQAWMDKVARIHPEMVVDDGLSDHEALAKVPVELTGTCHYYQIAKIMARFASVSGDQAGVVKYNALADKIRLRIIDLFWDTPSIEVPNRQTLLATLIVSEVLEPGDQKIAVDQLVQVMKDADYHVTTGIFGTKYLLEALSSNNCTDIAFRIVNQSGFPGWKNMMDNGATTLWETWKESDNTFSQNHPMFGSVSEWYLKWLGGIQPDQQNPEVNSIVLQPRPVMGLDSLTAEKIFPSGILVSRWWWKDKTLCFEFVIPEGLKTHWGPGAEYPGITAVQSPEGWNMAQNRTPKGISLNRAGRYVFELKN